jgi:hypothetical protein
LIEIECVRGPTPATERRREFHSLCRMGRGDESATAHHIWRGRDSYAPSTPGWDMGRIVRYYCVNEPHPHGWSYLFRFTDGTRGTCQVNQVNQALATLGWQVDRRGDADRD